MKGDIIRNGKTYINDKHFPIGGFRFYNTLECRSDVKYRGRVENAHWAYVDPVTKEEQRLDCEGAECEELQKTIGWRSYSSIYKNGTTYYGTVRLGRTSEKAVDGTFKCYFKDDSNSPVSVDIVDERSKCKITYYKFKNISIKMLKMLG